MPNTNEKFHSVNGKRRVLIADDEPINREILGAILGNDYEVIFACDGEETLKLIRENRDVLSLVLLDLVMPHMSGIEVLRSMRDDMDIHQIPVIVITSDQTAEIECLGLGAIDFIPKPYPQAGVILARVQRTIELSEDRDIIRFTERDVLTGLYNREYFYRYAQQFDQHHKDMEMDAIVIDVNHFHMINERYGKSYGDEVLRRIGEKVREMVRDSGGIVCRREADTFLVYCPHGKDYKAILENASVGLAGEGEANGRVRLRMGVYSGVDKSIDIERRFDRAKLAADTVRNSFTRKIAIYDKTLHESELYAEQLIEDFREAVEQRQFKVFYQPKFDVCPDSPVLAGAEALVRWQHPRLGLVSPGVFIPLFEENGLIRELDNYVWREAAAQISQWKARFGVTVPVSVNVSRIDMYDPDIIDTLSKIRESCSLAAEDLRLEITESAYTQDSGQIIETVERLRALGFRIEMDDFGTGYSSLNMISSLPIDALKLDMLFIRNAFRADRDTRMLEIIIDIADYLGVPVIAEGVETEEQVQALRSMGCDIVQGFYFSRPVPAEEFDHFVEERSRISLLPSAESSREKRVTPRKKEKDDDLVRIASALTSDFESIYYIDVDSGEYSRFASRSAKGDPGLAITGSDFYADLQKDVRNIVHPEDREKVIAALERQRLQAVLAREKSVSVQYRLVTDSHPVNYSMRILPLGAGDCRRVVIGVRDLSRLLPENSDYERERRRSVTYSSIAQALAADYFSIYYVDTETDRFIEYSSHEEYQELDIEKSGEDFFGTSRKNILRVVDAEDREKLDKILVKEYMMKELSENGSLMITYRLLFGGVPTYVTMKATRMEDANDKHIVIGVSNVDAQVRREQEYERQLGTAKAMANRDALTGVKSKHAFVEAEKTWNARLAAGAAEPFAVVVCDVNGLKEINDTLGHKAGDTYIKDACAAICATFKHSPVYRIGGDEFVAVLYGSDYENRSALMERMADINTAHEREGGVTVACGMETAELRTDTSFEAVFERADAAMYENKRRFKCV